MADDLQREFARQLENLLARGYPELAGTTREAFVEQVAPLERRLPDVCARTDGSAVPFVIVIRSTVVATEPAMARVELEGKRGVVHMHPTEPAEYAPIDGLDVPPEPAYLAVGVDTGPGTLNVTPDAALETIAAEGRSPLTIDEGVALVTHHPELLRTQNAFSILGSRRADRRVPAIWISAGAPRLGWCWAGNPHTWLGSASCAARMTAS